MFYDKYAQLCKRRGVSMSAAAVEAGLSKSLVTKWKTNKVDVPSPDVLKKLSAYFNMPVSELLGEETKKDVHEANVGYLKACREAALYTAEKFNWNVVKCFDGDEPLSIEEIGNTIYNIVEEIL